MIEPGTVSHGLPLQSSAARHEISAVIMERGSGLRAEIMRVKVVSGRDSRCRAANYQVKAKAYMTKSAAFARDMHVPQIVRPSAETSLALRNQ